MDNGTLFVVATPIGDVDDLSPRAKNVLERVSVIAAEDTRVSGRLLQAIGVSTPMMSLHEHNERARVGQLLQRLQAGEDIALISDAGTPLISDPGYPLVHATRQENIEVVPVPGPCALISALSVSGLPTDRFVFEGFLPSKGGNRRSRLQALVNETRTLIFYESPRRVQSSIEDMLNCFGGDRAAVVARELTKTYETIKQGSLAELSAWLVDNPSQQRGEFVVIVAGAAEVDEDEQAVRRVLGILMADLPVSQAATLTAQICDQKRNKIYKLAQELKDA